MTDQDRRQLFDAWAEDYDETVQDESFPFLGYSQVLTAIVESAAPSPGEMVLDLGTGTGDLATRFVSHGCRVWGVDFSEEMLERARQKSSLVTFVRADVLGHWPSELPPRFHQIVSAYLFHEFDMGTKVSMLQKLAFDHLMEGGRVVIGDIAFATADAWDHARRRWKPLWDEDEHYWIADRAIELCHETGLDASYTQISECGGVFVFTYNR